MKSRLREFGEELTVKMDSGAIDWVFTPQAAQAFKLQPTTASANGVHYRAANGTEIHNFGQRVIRGYADTGAPLNVAAQIASVNSNLGSVHRVIEAGSKVVFDKDGSYIQNKKTGKKINIRNEGGAFEFDIWVPKAKVREDWQKSSKSRNVTENRKDTCNTRNQNRFAPLSEEEDSDDMEIGQCGTDLVFTRQE